MADLRILAVDDSPTMRRIIVNTLKRAGYNDITEATDGRDALAKMKVSDFNFVITGWNMPEMDGIEFVSRVRNTPEMRAIPILMVTARSVQEDIVTAVRAGVNSYIVKPFSPDTLKEKIEEVLAGK